MALYSKYRPASFAEVIGQQHVTEPISTALTTGRINHAYLFSGPRGCGKTSSARILARSLNCAHGPTPHPCGECDSCLALAPGGGGSLDVTELDAASHGGVDDTRDLREKAFFAPASSRYRVLIIDEAHMVTPAGFNALLKIVEEPPEHLIFIFATTEPDKVLPTIRSRTHHYPFRLLTPTDMRRLVEGVCEQEKVTVEPAVFPLVIRAGGGSPRDTLSVLDQLLAGADERGVTYVRALQLLGATELTLLDDTMDALAACDAASTFRIVDRVIEAGHDPRRFATDLLQRLRDLIVVQAVPQAVESGLVDIPTDQSQAVQEQAQRFGPATLARLASEVHNGMSAMRGATSPRLLLEIMCARLVLPAADDSVNSLLQRVEQLERSATAHALAPTPTSSAAPTPSAVPNSSLAGADTAVHNVRKPNDSNPDIGEPTPTTEARTAPVEQSQDAPRFVRRSQRLAAEKAAGSAAEVNVAETGAHHSAAPESTSRVTPEREQEPEVSALAPASVPTPPKAESADETIVREHSVPSGTINDDREEVHRPASAPVNERTHNSDSGDTGQAVGSQSGISTATAGLGAEDLRRGWSEVRSIVRSHTRTVEVMLAGATVGDVDGEAVTLLHDYAPLARRLNEPHNAEVIARSISAVFGGNWHVRCTAGPPANTAPPAAVASTGAGSQLNRAPSGREPTGKVSPRGSTADFEPPPEEPEREYEEYSQPAQRSGVHGGVGSGAVAPQMDSKGPARDAVGGVDAEVSGPASEDDMLDDANYGPKNLDRRTTDDIALALLRKHLGATVIE